MEWFSADDYEIAREILQRGIAAIFVVAFVSTAAQFRPLLGEKGFLPVRDFVAATWWWSSPSLFRIAYSDRLLIAATSIGAIIGLATVAGLPQSGPPWLPLVAFLVMWVLYLSIVNVGQTFYGFGWETLLLEAGFLAAFLGSRESPPPLPVIVLFWWLVFRLEFGAGMIKMRGDRSWRDLTALYYHHETQPMPNPLSRTAHLLPRWFHRGEVLANHVSQLVVPFLLFVPGPVGTVAGLIVVATQAWLVLTGNFAWLNVLTMILGFSAVADPAGFSLAETDAPSWWFVGLVLAVASVLVVLSVRPLLNLFSRHQLMNASFEPLHLVNAYGAFGSVTTERFEVVVEGTIDEDGDGGWQEYGFRGKPGDPTRRPRQFAPYHLRLDWLMWFLALGRMERWFLVFLARLLEADRATLRLLRLDPFAGRRPAFVRARLFRYRFATRDERRATGLYWIREPVQDLVPPVSLDGPAGLRGTRRR